MVFSLRKRAVVFKKDEEVEVSLNKFADTLPDVFITRVINQSAKKISLQLPPIRLQIVQPEMGVLVHFKRKTRLGSFKSKIIEVLEDEIPPQFSLSPPREVFWEDIVPSRLAIKEFYRPMERKLSLTVKSENAELEGVIKSAGKKELIFYLPEELASGKSIAIELKLEGRVIAFEAEVVKSREGEKGFEITVSLSKLGGQVRDELLKHLGMA